MITILVDVQGISQLKLTQAVREPQPIGVLTARPIQPTSQAIDSLPQDDLANLDKETRKLFLSAIERLEHPGGRSQEMLPKKRRNTLIIPLGLIRDRMMKRMTSFQWKRSGKQTSKKHHILRETEDSEQGISNNQETEESEQGTSNNQETEYSGQGTSDDQEIDDEVDTEDDTYDNDTSDNGTSDNEIMPRSINEGDDPNKVSDIQFLKEAGPTWKSLKNQNLKPSNQPRAVLENEPKALP
ncbi:hypothetical protein DSO57_1020398 [Entomophthora muscae]|uniref:Uncharacterized protein n=1 Tax=Entomophthora muscae TaxID=34485 RepID=A0ACC2RIC3_9FUNG|nr:hypothetical protein DSO57_1020398 [Entomophthora muscae]